MNYPTKVQIGPHDIAISYRDDYVYEQFTCQACSYTGVYLPEQKTCKICGSKLLDPTNAFVHGVYRPNTYEVILANKPLREDTVGVNMIHELIHAVDAIKDLKLNHTQITSLGESLYQAFSTGRVDFAPTSGEVALAA